MREREKGGVRKVKERERERKREREKERERKRERKRESKGEREEDMHATIAATIFFVKTAKQLLIETIQPCQVLRTHCQW